MELLDHKSSNELPAFPLRICLSCHQKFNQGEQSCPQDKTQLITPPKDPLVGSKLAEDYQIEALLGSGGWSLVWRARQKSLGGRQVAIKILHAHLMFDPDKVMRFQREAESSSRFNNPAIPAVYDFGVLHTGQPYMVMAYVEGQSLAEVAESGPMPVDGCLDVFIQAAAGLASAHEHGIIHRDVKPSNILLTKGGVVKILDFGLAKLIEPSDGQVLKTLTQAGHTIGTPAYMSPEQCLGQKLDGRSDIYSLGCVMYELVSGKRAFDGSDAFEAMTLHLKGEISFADTPVKDTIPQDLENCILKALAKNPAERFQTAAELQSELERIRSVGARSKTAVGRFKQSALRLFKQRQHTFNQILTVSITAAVVLALAITAFKFTLQANQSLSGQVGNLAETYTDYMTKGERRFYAGDYRQAELNFTRASEIAENFGHTDARLHNSLQRLQDTYVRQKRTAEAKKIAQRMEAIKQSTYGLMYGTPADNAREIINLTAMRDRKPKDIRIARSLCAVLNNQAALMYTQFNFSAAKQFLDHALEIEKKTLGFNDPEYATTLSNLAYYEAERGDHVKAETLYKQALELRRKIIGPYDTKVGRSLRNLGDFYWKRGDMKQAQAMTDQAMQVYRKKLPGTASDYAWTVNNLGLIYAAQRNYAGARKLFEEALSIRKQLYGKEGLDVGRTLFNLAQLDTAEHRYKDADDRYRQALKIYDTRLGTEQADTIRCAYNLAIMYFHQRNYTDAEPLLKRVVSVLSRKKVNNQMKNDAYDRLLQIYRAQNRSDAANELQVLMQNK